MGWHPDLPKCPVSREDRGEFMKPQAAGDETSKLYADPRRPQPATAATELAAAVARLRASTNGDDAAFEEGNPFDDLTLLLADYDRLVALSVSRPDGKAAAE